MSDRNWRITVRFAHHEEVRRPFFTKPTTGGLFHVWAQQIAPTLEEAGWVDARTLSRDDVFVYQKIVRSMGLDIGYGGTDETASFQTSSTKFINEVLFKTPYADKFGTDKKNSSGRDWAFKGGKQNWPVSPKWKITVEFTHDENWCKSTDGGKFHVWAQQIEPTVGEEHYLDGSTMGRDDVFDYQEIVQSCGLDIGKAGRVQKDSVTTSRPAVVNRLLYITEYGGNFGSKVYGHSFGIEGKDYTLGMKLIRYNGWDTLP